MSYTGDTSETAESLSRREFLQESALAGAGVLYLAYSGHVFSEPFIRSCPIPSKLEIQQLTDDEIRETINSRWGFEITPNVPSERGNLLNPEEYRRYLIETLQALSIFPPRFADMIFDYIPVDPTLIRDSEGVFDPNSDVQANLTNRRITFIKVMEGESPGYTYSDGEICVSDSSAGIKTTLIHELGHVFAYSLGCPQFSVTRQYVGSDYSEYKSVGPTSDYVSNYAMSHENEDRAETFSYLFSNTPGALDTYVKSRGELALKYQMLFDALLLRSAGQMDIQYFKDLAEDKVDIDYFNNKPNMDLIKPISSSYYITRTNKANPYTVTPALVGIDRYPQGSISYSTGTEKNVRYVGVVDLDNQPINMWLLGNGKNTDEIALQVEQMVYHMSQIQEGEEVVIRITELMGQITVLAYKDENGNILFRILDVSKLVDQKIDGGQSNKLSRRQFISFTVNNKNKNLGIPARYIPLNILNFTEIEQTPPKTVDDAQYNFIHFAGG